MNGERSMRKLFLLILALLIVGAILVSCDNSNKVDNYIFKSGSVEIVPGEDSAAVISALGEANSYDEEDIGCGNNEMAKVYNYGGFQIKTYPDNSKDYIDIVTIKNDSVSTPEGITIGSSRDDVISAYGEDYEAKGDGLIYKKDKTTLNIVIRNDAVTSIYYDYDFE